MEGLIWMEIEFLDLTNLQIAHEACDIDLPFATFNRRFRTPFLILTYDSPLEREMMSIELRHDYDLFNFKIDEQYYAVTGLKEFETSAMENEETGYHLIASCVPLTQYDGLLYLGKKYLTGGVFPVIKARQTASGKFIGDNVIFDKTIVKDIDPEVIKKRHTNLLPINFYAYRKKHVFKAVCLFNILDPASQDVAGRIRLYNYNQAIKQQLEESKKKGNEEWFIHWYPNFKQFLDCPLTPT